MHIDTIVGQPRRHLLTTGWSVFVSAKKLVAGDAFIFLRYGHDHDWFHKFVKIAVSCLFTRQGNMGMVYSLFFPLSFVWLIYIIVLLCLLLLLLFFL